MYTDFFGLKETPFSIAPDPRYLYMSERHREALAHLLYGIGSNGGFVLLTGEVGTGKTTVCRCLLEQVPESTEVAFIFNPRLTEVELLASICDELGINCPWENRSIKIFVDHINKHLLAAHARGCNTVLIIDEAQNLSTEVLEQLRLLTNLETNKRKLLQIILLGQPELHDQLARPELRQLAQRITARYYLGPLEKHEITDYIKHRLSVAGSHDVLFDRSSLTQLFRLSRGVPRLINVLCDRAMLGAYALNQKKVDGRILTKAAREVFGENTYAKPRSGGMLAWLVTGLFLAAAGLFWTYYYHAQEFTWLPALFSSTQTLKMQLSPPNAAHIQEKQPSPSSSTQTREKQPVPEKPTPAPATLQWPDSDGIAASHVEAFTELFRLWDIPYSSDTNGDPCLFAQPRGLQCLKNKGSLQRLYYLNRPALLELRNAHGEQLYVVLTQIHQQTAQLFLAGQSKIVDLKELERQWFGRFTLLWRPPPQFRGDILPDMHGQDVKWLSTQLSLIQGDQPPIGGKSTYDQVLGEQIKAFQQSQGLLPDGIAGAQTLIRLNTILDKNIPMLHSGQENG